jgi:arylformamidase
MKLGRRGIHSALLPIAAVSMLTTASAQAQSAAAAPAAQEIAYGSHPLQKLDFWRGRHGNAPLLLFVHGGGWRDGDKEWIGEATLAHYLGNGFAYASTNYRLVPEASIEQQVQDVANAVAFLLARADNLGIRRDRVMLIGHSSGGHVAALIGTDPRFLQQAGLQPAVLGGVVLLEGAGLARRPQGSAEASQPHPVFGSPERQLMLSPSSHAAAPNAERFLMLIAGSAELRRQASVLGEALNAAGTSATIADIPDSDHNQLVTNLGMQRDQATSVIDEFARKVFALRPSGAD